MIEAYLIKETSEREITTFLLPQKSTSARFATRIRFRIIYFKARRREKSRTPFSIWSIRLTTLKFFAIRISRHRTFLVLTSQNPVSCIRHLFSKISPCRWRSGWKSVVFLNVSAFCYFNLFSRCFAADIEFFISTTWDTLKFRVYKRNHN